MTFLCSLTQLLASSFQLSASWLISVWGTEAICMVDESNLTAPEASHQSSSTLEEFSKPRFQHAWPERNCEIPSSLSVGELFEIQGAPQFLIVDESSGDAGTMQIPIQCAWGGAREPAFFNLLLENVRYTLRNQRSLDLR